MSFFDKISVSQVESELPAGTKKIGSIQLRNAADDAYIEPVAETSFNNKIGEVQATPTSNTVLGRLKDLLTGIVLATGNNIIGRVSINQTTDGTTNRVVAKISQANGENTVTIASGQSVMLETSSNTIGHVAIDQSQEGVTNKVASDMYINGTLVGATNPVAVRNYMSHPTDTTTRPNDQAPYAQGDVVGESPAGNLVFNNAAQIAGRDLIIMGASLQIHIGAIPTGMGTFRLHLYNVAPTAIVDNSSYNLAAADRAAYIGYIEFVLPTDNGDTLWCRVDNLNMGCKLAVGSTTLYGVLETRGAYTPPQSVVSELTLHIMEV